MDIIAAILAKGDTTNQIGLRNDEYGLSQVFISINIGWLNEKFITKIVQEVIQNLHNAEPAKKGGKTYYPGERTLLTRIENKKSGIPVNDKIWNVISSL